MSDVVMVGPDETVGMFASAEDALRIELLVYPPADATPDPRPVAQVRTYSQRDPRYADRIYAGGLTFRAAGCLVVDVAMIASLIHDEETTYPPEVARRLREAGAFGGALLSHPARIPDALPGVHWGGVIHWRTVPARLDVLADEIEHYGATICEVKFDPTRPLVSSRGVWNQHFIVVEAVDVDGDDAVIVDPWTGDRGLLSQSRSAKPMGWGARQALYGIRMVRAVGE